MIEITSLVCAGFTFTKKLILVISLGALLIIFLIAMFILCVCTLPTALHRRALEKRRESEGADKDASAPLLANMDDTTDMSGSLSSRPPPTNPAMMMPLRESMPVPVISPQGGAVSEQPLWTSGAMPTAPPPLISYYTPQESSMHYHAPDAPPGVLPSVPHPMSTGSMYPPLLPPAASDATAPDATAPDGRAGDSELEGGGGR